jgi:eukaryotic-like serine/threonine-protein kinase
MPETRFQLRAVLFADIVGFTTWMEQDFDFATGLVKQVRDVMGTMVASHGGIIHRQFGDGFLLTFSSAVEAVRFALNLNEALPESEPPALRIGIEVGEVAVLDEDLQGKAANMGARLHALAAPRTVIVSGNVQQSIQNQVEFEVVFRGTEHLKNIKEPVDTYTVRFRSDTYDRRFITPFKLLHYDVLEKIGEGGMGEVYLAQDTRLNRSVAIKVLPEDRRDSPEMVGRLRAEAEAAAQLNHANIATTYAVEESEDLVFIVMEYIDGETLSDKIPQNGLDFNTFYEWYVPLAQGLSHAHSKGIIHRDIKPSNIMVSRDNVPKILDFGLATMSSLPRTPSRIDHSTAKAEGRANAVPGSGSESGNPGSYHSSRNKSSESDWTSWANMSPEQITDGGMDHRSDMYSFGVTMYRGLTGTQPFQAADEDSLLKSIIYDHPTPIREIRPDTPRRLIKITDRMLAKEIGNRYESTEQFVQALSASRDRRWRRALAYSVLAVAAILLMLSVTLFGEDLRSWSAGTIGWPPVPAAPRISVFSLDDPKGDVESRVIQGLYQEVKTGLSVFKNLRVTSDIAVRTLQPREVMNSDPREIMRALSVDFLLLGRSLNINGRTQFSAEMLDRDLTVMASNTWWDDESNLSDVKANLILSIVNVLEIPYTEEERQLASGIGTSNQQAQERYLAGLGFMGSHDDVGNRLARQAFEEAILLDGDFADAHARLGQAYRLQWALNPFIPGSDRIQLVDKIRVSLANAIRLNPNLSVAFLERGYFELAMGRIDSARTALERAARLSPSDITGWMAQRDINMVSGDYRDALVLAQRIVDREPFVFRHYQHLGRAQSELKQFEDAIETLSTLLTLEPAFVPAYHQIARIYGFHLRNYDEAIRWFLDASRLGGASLESPQNFELAEYYIHAGRIEEALSLFSAENLRDFPFRNLAEHALFDDLDLLISYATQKVGETPQFYSGYYSLALAAIRNGKTGQAQTFLDSSIRVLTRKTVSEGASSATETLDHLFLGLSLAEVGQDSAAITHVGSGQSWERDWAMYLSAVIYAKTGRVDEAVRNLRGAANLRPYWVDLARYDLGFMNIRNEPSFMDLLAEYD